MTVSNFHYEYSVVYDEESEQLIVEMDPFTICPDNVKEEPKVDYPETIKMLMKCKHLTNTEYDETILPINPLNGTYDWLGYFKPVCTFSTEEPYTWLTDINTFHSPGHWRAIVLKDVFRNHYTFPEVEPAVVGIYRFGGYYLGNKDGHTNQITYPLTIARINQRLTKAFNHKKKVRGFLCDYGRDMDAQIYIDHTEDEIIELM